MGAARNFVRSRLAVSALITAVVFAVIAGARSIGWLEALELGAYDWLLRSRPRVEMDDTSVVLIMLREEEIQKYGHPLCDARMAVALAKLQDLDAIAIGVDIYRDNPIPSCSGQLGNRQLPSENTDLAEVALRDGRVVMIAKPLENPPIAPPSFLEGTGQIGVPDFNVDKDGIIRRGLITYHSHENVPYFSLSLQLALRYLQAQEIYPTNDPDQPELIRIGDMTVPMFQSNDG
ncbi:MAG: CHASE2 domain-containing protein, partial [Deltaproteobacteria bacterium]|nr:CHASE2 domain-containing protein [Deltaproteobacteria bacterium]